MLVATVAKHTKLVFVVLCAAPLHANMATALDDPAPLLHVPDAAQPVLRTIFEHPSAPQHAKVHADSLVYTESVVRKLVQHAESFVLEAPSPDTAFMDSLQTFSSTVSSLTAATTSSTVWPHLLKLALLSRELDKIRQRANENTSRIAQQMRFIAAGQSPSDVQAALDKATKAYDKDKGKRKGSVERKAAAMDVAQRTLQLGKSIIIER